MTVANLIAFAILLLSGATTVAMGVALYFSAHRLYKKEKLDALFHLVSTAVLFLVSAYIVIKELIK